MPQIEHHITGPQYWRSLEQLAEAPEVLAQIEAEFPGYDPEQILGLSRRRFMKLMAASMALAGIGLTGCRRWPKEALVPQTSNPDGRIPGINEHYATVMELGGVGMGLLVTSYGGRPIKIEGNALHPFSKVTEKYGSADAIAQASVLELYDPDRSRGVLKRGARDGHDALENSDLDAFRIAAAAMFPADGAGVAILCEAASGPTMADLGQRFIKKFPQAKWYEYEPISHDEERAATRQAFGQPLRTRLHLERADVVVSLDCDFLGTHPAHTRYANDWVKRRKSADADKKMSRVYVAESCFSITGAAGDERLPIRPSRLAALAQALAAGVGVTGVAAPKTVFTQTEADFLAAAVEDLKKAGKHAVVAAGSHLPSQTQAIAFAINALLGADGNTLTMLRVPDVDRPPHHEAIATLAKEMRSGAIKTLLVLGGNPAYDAPAEFDFPTLLRNLPNTIHLGIHLNETSLVCGWHLPRAHYLESWGDARAYDGTISLQQPLIEPLFGGISSIELLAMLSGDELKTGRELVLRTFGGDELAFRRSLHDGVVPNSSYSTIAGAPRPLDAMAAVGTTTVPAMAKPQAIATPDGELEVRFFADASVYDGRFANSGWLQEMPDPLTKLTWDNAALLSKSDADKLSVGIGDMIRLTVEGRSLEIAVFILPGQPIGVIGLPLGYGRWMAGRVGTGLGFNSYALRLAGAMSAAGATVEKLGRKYVLASTVEHHIIDEVGFKARTERIGEKGHSGSVIRETTLAEYQANPRAAQPHHHGNVSLQLFEPPMKFNEPHAWGMAIDMTACIGCNACVIGCQSENNIPVVGKDEVVVNREMHWIRIDRYFKGAMDDPNPEVAFQPMMCVHCENAPCEQVCPVAATTHDTEGLNVMTYNRCIGTRYCSNNCPYKVRRFNYFDWHATDPRGGRFPMPWPGIPDQQQVQSIDPIKQMVFNPDVTVRMRGVMEKCTYCTQRISAAKIEAKNEFLAGKRPSDTVADGDVLTACQQACPTQAITFGNLNDRAAAVTGLHQNPRAYSVLEDLNTRPRSKHLARVRNPSESKESNHG
ncbi:MAG: TAT-variant-translocated molybdopterin oxidoreductase [Tepidisphaeraceae bacterium]